MTTDCLRCKTPNPDGQRYCGDCGATLSPDAVLTPADTSLEERIRQILNDRYENQKLVEIETAQAIAQRLSDWAKLLAFFVGIPVALLLLVLGGLGIKSYNDFSGLVERSQKDVAQRLENAQQRATKLQTEGASLASDYEKLRAQFTDTAELAAKVNTLTAQVDRIGERLGFAPTSKIPSDIKSGLETAFDGFQRYLNGVGYRPPPNGVKLDIRKVMGNGMLAYYDPGARTMVIDAKYASDPDLLYHEYMHRVLYDGPGMTDDPELYTFVAIESALAAYFPCSYKGTPKLAETSARLSSGAVGVIDLTRKGVLKRHYSNYLDAMAHGAEDWGAALWDMRQALGAADADKLIFRAWQMLKPEELRSNDGTVFVAKLVKADRDVSGGKRQSQIKEIFGTKGLVLSDRRDELKVDITPLLGKWDQTIMDRAATRARILEVSRHGLGIEIRPTKQRAAKDVQATAREHQAFDGNVWKFTCAFGDRTNGSFEFRRLTDDSFQGTPTPNNEAPVQQRLRRIAP